MGADGAYFSISGETLVAVKAAKDLGPVQPERYATGIFQPGPAQFQGAGDGGVDQPDLAHRDDMMRAELPADGHPLAVERHLRLLGAGGWRRFPAVGPEDLCTVEAHGAADPRADHAERTGHLQAAMTVDAAVHCHVIRDQGLGVALPLAEVGSLQLDIMMEAGTLEVHRAGAHDMPEPEIAVEFQVVRIEPGKDRVVEDQAVEPRFAHRDQFIEDASPQDNGMPDPGVAQIQLPRDTGAGQ